MKNLFKLAFLLIAICLVYTTGYTFQGGGRPMTTPSDPVRTPSREPRRTPRRESRTSASESTRNISPTTLNIKSFPASCTVIVNGRPAGTTDANGYLRLNKLKPGQYIIIARKQDYRDGQRTIQVEPGQEASLEITLNAIPGTLNVMPSVAGANINVSSMGNYAGQINNLSLAPGSYRIEVTKPGYQNATRNLEMPPAKSIDLAIPLEPLRTDQALAQAEQYLRGKDFNTAAAICEVVLKNQPDNIQANILMGYSHYYAGRFDQSLSFLFKALAANQQIEIPIKCYQKVSSGDDLFSGRLILGRGNFGFQSTERSGFDFNVASNKIHELKVEMQKGGRIYAQVGIIQGSSKKEKKEKFYFHPTTSVVNRARKSAIECNTCDQELQAIFQLIQRVKT